MNEAEYFKCAVPEPWTILGLRLRAFSAGHLILLTRVESAFLIPDAVPTWDDLAVSVFICSQTFEDATAAFSDPNLDKFMERWHRKLSGARWYRRGRAIDFTEKATQFAQYLKEGSYCPEYIYKEGGNTIGDIPAVQFVKAFLMSKTSMSESDFLNRGWSLSMWDFLTIQGLEGGIQFCSDETVEEAKEVGAKLAKLVKDGKWRTS